MFSAEQAFIYHSNVNEITLTEEQMIHCLLITCVSCNPQIHNFILLKNPRDLFSFWRILRRLLFYCCKDTHTHTHTHFHPHIPNKGSIKIVIIIHISVSGVNIILNWKATFGRPFFPFSPACTLLSVKNLGCLNYWTPKRCYIWVFIVESGFLFCF